MTIKQGYAFEDEFRRSIERLVDSGFLNPLELWYYKMVDTHSFSAVKEAAGNSTFIVPKVPADWEIIYQGRPMFVECKLSSNPVSYNTAYIKEHQLEHGLKLMAQGVPYYFAINNRSKSADIKPGQKQQYDMYLISARNLYTLMMMLQAQGKKSIKWEYLREICDHYVPPEARDTKTSTWDLKWLFLEGYETKDKQEGAIGQTMKKKKKKSKKETLVGYV